MKISSRFGRKLSKEEVIAAKDVLDTIAKILTQDLEAEVKRARSEEAYESPSWPLIQADSIGAQRTLRKVIDIVTISED